VFRSHFISTVIRAGWRTHFSEEDKRRTHVTKSCPATPRTARSSGAAA